MYYYIIINIILINYGCIPFRWLTGTPKVIVAIIIVSYTCAFPVENMSNN